MAQHQCLLTSTGFTEFVFPVHRSLFFIRASVSSTSVTSCSVGGNQVSQFLLFRLTQNAPNLLFFFTQRQLCFFPATLPVGRWPVQYDAITVSFSASARAELERTSTSVSSISRIINRTSFCGSSAFSSNALMLAFTMSAKTRKKYP
uniref:Uncharacterized protein n=1 Tax=Klebsiella pneumoniae TaxID=573 RepID=A0A8B0SUK3_KLEPN|nr:hypothetical protein [Klebsiella pneumoniae]